MAEIITSLEPGQYSTGQSITVTFPANTRRAIITRDDRAPVLTEILAYDTGPIPPGTTPQQRPFIAVTQDGRGNVTFDGGFPKFYNAHIKTANGDSWPPLPYTSFSQLPPAAEYLNNCIKFCANPRKVLAGNRKVLVMNTSMPTEEYNIEQSYRTLGTIQSSSCFADTFEGIGQVGNWTITTRGVSSAGGKFDFTLDYFDQFACVIFMGTASYASPPTEAQRRITEKCAQELSIYRMNGNGVILITDHTSGNFNNIAEAQNGYVFSPDVNRVAKYYDAYFSGNVDRSPVLVGTIRQQLIDAGGDGNFPLFEGLADNEYIYAGSSESITKAELHADDIVPHDQPWTATFSTAGTYRVNVLVQLEDGTILTKPMRFIIIDPSDIKIRDSFDNPVGASQTTYMQVVEYNVDGANTNRTLQGKIQVDGDLVSWFTATPNDSGGWSTQYFPLGGLLTPVLVKNGQTVKWTVTEPFEFGVSCNINIPDPSSYYTASSSVSTFNKAVVNHPYFTGKALDVVYNDMTNFTAKYYQIAADLGNNIPGQRWKQIGKSRTAFAASGFIPIKVRVYTDTTQWNANMPAVGQKGDSALIASNNDLYYWDDLPMVWQLHPKKATVLFDVGRKVINTLDNSNWILNASNTTKVT